MALSHRPLPKATPLSMVCRSAGTGPRRPAWHGRRPSPPSYASTGWCSPAGMPSETTNIESSDCSRVSVHIGLDFRNQSGLRAAFFVCHHGRHLAWGCSRSCQLLGARQWSAPPGAVPLTASGVGGSQWRKSGSSGTAPNELPLQRVTVDGRGITTRWRALGHRIPARLATSCSAWRGELNPPLGLAVAQSPAEERTAGWIQTSRSGPHFTTGKAACL